MWPATFELRTGPWRPQAKSKSLTRDRWKR